MSGDSTSSTGRSSEAVLRLMEIEGRYLISTPDLAIKIAEVLCEAGYGKNEVDRQRPFVATDKETYWRVEGSLNRDGEIAGSGHFYVSIEKFNCRVTEFGMLFRYGADGEAYAKQIFAAKTFEERQAIFEKHLKENGLLKGDGEN